MAINKRTVVIKAVREASMFLGYSNLIKTPYDVGYWMGNYDLMFNLSNPWENYQFVGTDGTITERSLAQLCDFQEGAFNDGVRECSNVIRELEAADVISRNNLTNWSPSRAPTVNFNFLDSRFNNPNAFFNFPHYTDVYTPDAVLPPGIPYAKLDRFNGWKPTNKIFSSDEFGTDAMIAFCERIKNAFNSICSGANIHPGLFVMLYEALSPPDARLDYAQMDRIAANIISTRGLNSGSRGSTSTIYGYEGDITPRALWAKTFDASEYDNAIIARDFSDMTGIPLEANAFSFFCRQAHLFKFPSLDTDPAHARITFNPAGTIEEQTITRSLANRSTSPIISQGVRVYGSAVTSFMQMVNVCELIKNHPPQVFLHSAMSFHNSVLTLAFNQLRGNQNLISNYRTLWNQEVAARAAGTPGPFGTRVALYSDITPENIGTMALYAGRASGGTTGVVIQAVSMLLRSMDSNEYGELMSRASHSEFIRQSGSPGLDSTIFRGITPQKILNCRPVIRINQV